MVGVDFNLLIVMLLLTTELVKGATLVVAIELFTDGKARRLEVALATGQMVTYWLIVSVVTDPYGQFVTEAAHSETV